VLNGEQSDYCWPKNMISTLCLKNIPPHVCYNFDIHERILTLFGRNITDKVSNQKTFYYMPTQTTCASALPGKSGKHENRIFFTQMLYQCIARIQLVAPWFLQSFWLTSHTHAAVWLLRSCTGNQCVQVGADGGMVQEKVSRQCRSGWTLLHAQCICTNALSS